MTLSRAKQIDLLCKAIAQDHDGWVYSAKAFKYKGLKYVTKTVDFGWSGSSVSVSSQPIVTIMDKKIEKIWKYLEKGGGWTQFLRVMSPEDSRFQYRKRIKDIQADGAESYIREVLDIGMRMLEENWDFSSEENLLRNLPIDDPTLPKGEAILLDGDLGTRYCIAKMLLGDFDYIERFYRDEIKTPRPKRKADLEILMKHIPEFKADFEKKGILYI